MIPFPHRKTYVLVAAVIVVLVGCGKSEEKAATQVAAKVDKDEISVHQINFVLARSGNIPPEQVPVASKQILEKLIDQDLLMQKAMTDKMDRDPNVMQALENSRNQILAQAYLEKAMSGAAKPTEDEISKYFEQHPELFSQRRIFRFQQISISGNKDTAAEVQQQISSGKNLNDVVSWAQSKNYRVSNNAVVKPAEQLPMELLPRLHQMKDGQVGIIGEPNGASIIQLLASQDQHVDEKAAAGTISQYLINKRKSELAEAEIKQLRTTAKIEYMGDFAKKETSAVPSAEQAKPVLPPATTPESDAVSKAIGSLK